MIQKKVCIFCISGVFLKTKISQKHEKTWKIEESFAIFKGVSCFTKNKFMLLGATVYRGFTFFDIKILKIAKVPWTRVLKSGF